MPGGTAGDGVDVTVDVTVDVVVVGAGAAGLSLLEALLPLLRSGWQAGPGSGPVPMTAAVVEPTTDGGPARTWCSWTRDPVPAGGRSGPPRPVDEAEVASWPVVEIAAPDGRSVLDLRPYRYRMIRSGDYRRAVERATRDAGVRWVTDTADQITDGERAVLVRTTGGVLIRAQWVFDSRPVPLPPARTTLLQHFRGWEVTTRTDHFEPGRAVLMDFRTAQPDRGVSFGYLLPTGRRSALVEYTEFTRRPLASAQYDQALIRYLDEVLESRVVCVEGIEDGVIPMTDGRFRRRAGRRIFRIGTAGGATRPSTGYTFSATRRQGVAIAGRLAAGRTPVPPAAYPARHLVMDAVLLYGLDRGLLDGTQFFTRLFTGNPAHRVLGFLDGESGPVDELRLMATAPRRPMLRCTARWLAAVTRPSARR